MFAEGVDFDMGFTDKYPAVADGYTGFRLYGLWIYGLFGFISVIGSMVYQILVLNFSDIWSFRLYGQLYQDITVDYIRNPVYLLKYN